MPLILPSQRLIRPNPLAYPAGAVPRVDPNHPASQNLMASIIPQSTNGLSLGGSVVGFKQGTGTFAPSSLIDSALGPVLYDPSAATTSISFPRPAITPFDGFGLTYAAFFRPGANIGNNEILSAASANGGVVALFLSTLGVGNWGLRFYALSSIDSGIPWVTNVPYFTAVSTNFGTTLVSGSAGWITDFVVVRLDTGSIQTATISFNRGLDNWAASTSMCYGNASAPSAVDGFVGTLGAAMINTKRLSMSQLQAWAADPWSFWYPNKTINLSGTTPPPAFLVSAVQSWPSLGRAIEIIGAD